MKILHDNLLTKPVKEEKTAAGIILPESEKMQHIAEVIDIGNKVRYVQIGDKVKYHQHSGMKIEIENEEFLILKEMSEVIAIL